MSEDIVGQIRTLLQNQLPAKLDQIELERADGVTLEDIQSFFIQQDHKDACTQYPNITIVGEFTTSTNTLSRRRKLRHGVSIWVILREVSPDSNLAWTKLWRYVEAIERILTNDYTLGGEAIDSEVTNHVYFNKGGEKFIRMAVLIVKVLQKPSTSNY